MFAFNFTTNMVSFAGVIQDMWDTLPKREIRNIVEAIKIDSRWPSLYSNTNFNIYKFSFTKKYTFFLQVKITHSYWTPKNNCLETVNHQTSIWSPYYYCVKINKDVPIPLKYYHLNSSKRAHLIESCNYNLEYLV